MLGTIASVVSIAGGLNSLFGGNDGGSAAGDAAATSANTASQISQAQWNYYLQNYQPLETSLIKQATEAGSPEEFARARGAANADVTGAFDQSRKQTLSRMQSYGINPGSPAYQSAAASTDIAEGATKAGALTMADRNTRNLAYSKGLDVVGIGRNIPAQSAASAGTAANAATMASRNQFLTNQANMQNAGYGLNTIGTAAQKWFGTDQPVNTLAGGKPGSYLNWGNDDGYAEGGMIEAEKTGNGEYDATKVRSVMQSRGLHPSVAHGQSRGAAKRHSAITPHMRRFAQGGGVGMQGMEPMMPNGEVTGPGTETSDSIPATINGAEPAALSDGEYVMNAEVPKLSGDEILTAINEAGLKKRGLEPQTSDQVPPNAGVQAYADGGAVPAHGSNDFHERRRRQMLGSRNTPNPQPTDQEQHQAFLDHVSARYQGAEEERKSGKLGQGRYSQDDIDRGEAVFGKQKFARGGRVISYASGGLVGR